MEKQITTPLKTKEVTNLKAGDYVYITGVIYTARDVAHQRMHEALSKGDSLPFSIKDNILYYMGPSPARKGQIIGSAGPTTSSRMDKYTPKLLDMGLSGLIGKGTRSKEVITSMIKNKAVYFAATGGAGALLSKCIKEAKVIAYDELGTEAIFKLYVERLPVIVVIDSVGNNLYEIQHQIS
jgi:fumarate hydratase subunit beta